MILSSCQLILVVNFLVLSLIVLYRCIARLVSKLYNLSIGSLISHLQRKRKENNIQSPFYTSYEPRLRWHMPILRKSIVLINEGWGEKILAYRVRRYAEEERNTLSLRDSFRWSKEGMVSSNVLRVIWVVTYSPKPGFNERAMTNRTINDEYISLFPLEKQPDVGKSVTLYMMNITSRYPYHVNDGTTQKDRKCTVKFAPIIIGTCGECSIKLRKTINKLKIPLEIDHLIEQLGRVAALGTYRIIKAHLANPTIEETISHKPNPREVRRSVIDAYIIYIISGRRKDPEPTTKMVKSNNNRVIIIE
uniref:Uncharacterized protein n=1 Tax=Heterorhabditis bacteriophora TaxID=37862 RepID=A0A1I7W9Y2_HETBA